ncbi:MAG: hypothetical protein DI538_12340 [Azospira oryzae]|jgi:hypothetical protein|nr:hypothetical protein [Cytophaga sp.]PZR37540.1 MAG: hypothetical protein DI538_12340 [Azospira oryzae]
METTQATQALQRGEKDATYIQNQLTESEKLMPELRTLSYCLNKSQERGYQENFTATPQGLKSMESGKLYQPEEITIVNFYRFEGITDPADMAVLYVMETSDGAKGTLVDAYGTYSDSQVAQLIGKVSTIEKH